MADIDIKCQKCGTFVTVSEFADPTSIACIKCGEKLQKPDVPEQRPRPTVRVLKHGQAEAAAANEPPPHEWRFHKHVKKEEPTGQSALFSAHHVASWVIFVVLGGVGGWLRYGSYLQPQQLAMMKEFSLFLLLGLHIVVVLSAFKHSVFQGALSVMIPPYPYYFLFAVSDEFYLRAVVGGALIGIGQDAFVSISREAGVIYNVVTHWIASGG